MKGLLCVLCTLYVHCTHTDIHMIFHIVNDSQISDNYVYITCITKRFMFLYLSLYTYMRKIHIWHIIWHIWRMHTKQIFKRKEPKNNRVSYWRDCVLRKDPDVGKDWGQEEKGMTEDEMAGWCHWLHGREFEQAPGVGDGQGGLAWCSPWGRKVWDMAKWLNWTEETCCKRLATMNCAEWLVASH